MRCLLYNQLSIDQRKHAGTPNSKAERFRNEKNLRKQLKVNQFESESCTNTRTNENLHSTNLAKMPPNDCRQTTSRTETNT